MKLLKAARVAELQGKSRSAARLYARFALGEMNTRPVRARVAIERARRLVPSAPKLEAIYAQALFRCGLRAQAILSVDRFRSLIERRSNRDPYEMFFRELCYDDKDLLKRLELSEINLAPHRDNTLSCLVDSVAKRYELEVSVKTDSNLSRQVEGFVKNSCSDIAPRDRLDFAVALFEMGFAEAALQLVMSLPIDVDSGVIFGLRTSFCGELKRWNVVKAIALDWLRGDPMGFELVECHYQLALASVRMGDELLGQVHFEWLEKNAGRYRNLAVLSAEFRKIIARIKNAS